MGQFAIVAYDDSMVSEVYDLAAEGMDDADIAEALGLTRRELSAWRRAHSEFDSAIEAGRSAAQASDLSYSGKDYGGSGGSYSFGLDPSAFLDSLLIAYASGAL